MRRRITYGKVIPIVRYTVYTNVSGHLYIDGKFLTNIVGTHSWEAPEYQKDVEVEIKNYTLPGDTIEDVLSIKYIVDVPHNVVNTRLTIDIKPNGSAAIGFADSTVARRRYFHQLLEPKKILSKGNKSVSIYTEQDYSIADIFKIDAVSKMVASVEPNQWKITIVESMVIISAADVQDKTESLTIRSVYLTYDGGKEIREFAAFLIKINQVL